MIWSETSKGGEWKARDAQNNVWTVRKTGAQRFEGVDPFGHVVCVRETAKNCQRAAGDIAEKQGRAA